MKLGKYSILVCIVLSAFCLKAQASDCFFEMVPTLINADSESARSQYGLLPSNAEDSYCTMLALGQLMAASKVDSVDYVFTEFVRRQSGNGEVARPVLMVVMKYALFFNSRINSERSKIYFQWVKENAGSNKDLFAISSIYLLSGEDYQWLIGSSIDSLASLIDIDDHFGRMNLLHALFSHGEIKYVSRNFLEDNLELLSSEENNHILRYSILSQVLFNTNDIDSDLVEFARDLFNKFDEFEYELYPHLRKGEEALREGDYNEYMRNAKEAVIATYGQFSSVDDLIDTFNSEATLPNHTLSFYAHSNLYQTRIGGSIDYVKRAFKMYEAFFSFPLRAHAGNVREMSSTENMWLHMDYVTLLIVAGYLQQNTQDDQWLYRALSIADRYNGFGVEQWISCRKALREDYVYNRLFGQYQVDQKALLIHLPKMSLAQLASEEKKLNEKWQLVRDRLLALISGPDLPSVLADIKKLSQDSSAAVIGFYGTELTAYRFMAIGDMVSIDLVDKSLVNQTIIERLNYYLLINRKTNITDSLSYSIYQSLFADIAHLLPEKLHIVATGPMADIPFSALRTTPLDEPARYLGLDHVISRQFSIRSMRMLNDLELEAAVPRPLAMAPSFDDEFVAASELRQAGFALPPLLYNREEVEYLEELSDGTFLYDNDATLENYWDHAANHSILHIASHAISSEVDGVKSRVFFAGNGDRASALQAANVGDQTLNADLVVLSACETGGGGLHVTEGKVGLTKAYLAAGARSVVSSSWAVDDYATAEMMKSFYARIKAGDPPNVALQKARLAYVERHPDASPAKWAAFEAYGGMQPVRWEPEAPFELPWGWVIGGVVALAGAGYGVRRRKLRA